MVTSGSITFEQKAKNKMSGVAYLFPPSKTQSVNKPTIDNDMTVEVKANGRKIIDEVGKGNTPIKGSDLGVYNRFTGKTGPVTSKDTGFDEMFKKSVNSFSSDSAYNDFKIRSDFSKRGHNMELMESSKVSANPESRLSTMQASPRTVYATLEDATESITQQYNAGLLRSAL